MDDSRNIRSLSPEQGKISRRSRVHTLLACTMGEVCQLRVSSSSRLSERKEEEWWQSSFYSLQPPAFSSAFCFFSLYLSFLSDTGYIGSFTALYVAGR